MSRHPRMEPPDVAAWRAESVRVTAFPSADVMLAPDTWWKDVVGTEAAVETRRKGRLVHQDQGDALGGVMTLTVQPGRIDWSLGAKMPRDELLQDFPALGGVVDTLPKFIDLLIGWVPASPPIGRLALGVNARVAVPDRREAYGLLDALLPAVEVDPASTDFQYRINRPGDSGLDIPGLLINRLSTWAAIRLDLVDLAAGVKRFRAASTFAIRAELDVNTTPDFPGPLPAERRLDLLREFMRMSLEILTEGERP